jgi:Tfp pilus assembly protein PilF
MDREAITAYLSVRRQQPDHPGVAHALAVLYDRAGRVDEAAAEYRRALAEKPNDADLICDVGYFQYSTDRFDEAVASYRRALSLEPDHRQTKINLALLQAQRGHDEEAMRLFTEAIGPAAARHNLGMIKLRQGNSQAARALLSDAAARDPSVARMSTAVLASLDAHPSHARQQVVGSRAVQVTGGFDERWE